MSIQGKRDNFSKADLVAVGKSISLSKPEQIVDEILDAVAQWPEFARQAEVKPQWIENIQSHLLLKL